jgi:predicted alpha/beta superfamily hydrolase
MSPAPIPLKPGDSSIRFHDTLIVAVVAMALLAGRGLTQTPSQPITVGETFVIPSAVMREDRRVMVSLPESYGQTSSGYPVLFLLDGSSHIVHGGALVRYLVTARNRIPEMIVVALPNTNRNRDMTPGPGAAQFQQYLAEELIPWVEQKYRTVRERVVVGHSLSASFVVHTLLNRPALFSGYIAASAPLWRYDSLARDMRFGLARAAQAGAAVYLTVGELETENIRGGVQKFADALRAAPPAQAPVSTFSILPDEDHNSTPHRSLYNALESRYRSYRLPLFLTLAELDSVGGVEGMQRHYRLFGERFRYPALPPPNRVVTAAEILTDTGRFDEVIELAATYARDYPRIAEQIVNTAGYAQLRRGRRAEGLATLARNAAMFPDSPNVHDSLGDARCLNGDEKGALESRQNAVRAAERASHPRLPSYQARLTKPCAQP